LNRQATCQEGGKHPKKKKEGGLLLTRKAPGYPLEETITQAPTEKRNIAG